MTCGDGTLAASLRTVELGKHKLLLTHVIRLAGGATFSGAVPPLAAAYQLLVEVEAVAPPVVADLIGGPQFGAWANDVLNRLLGEPAAADEASLAADLGRLALFAATAAIRSGHPFRLVIPFSDGAASFPGLGTVRCGGDPALAWGTVSSDGSGWAVRRGTAAVAVTAGNGPTAGWEPLHWVTVTENCLRLAVVLDHDDPFLDRYGAARQRVTESDLPRWRELLAQGWRILARDHRELAGIVAETVRALVPLAPYDSGRAAGATEETSFGAIGLSLPADALDMAEALVHESHHAVLSALADIEPLIRDDVGRAAFRGYAPWRDDPRPAYGLLQGIYAHYGMGRFWRRQCLAGAARDGERAAAEFCRMRAMTARAIATLSGTGLLTDAGQELLAGVSRDVGTWLAEPLPGTVTRSVARQLSQHETRWQARWGAVGAPGTAAQ